MRLLRLRVTDFAGVREREVAFAERGVTVLVGPNETGKSTLLAALDLLLRLPDSSKANEVRDAQPVGRDVGPRVEAELTTGPYRLVYAKQWLREPQTTLRVTGPDSPQTLTGREAHNRAEAIFAETLDRTLWDALRVQQGELSQVPLARSASLQEALDRAAGGGLGGEDEHNLFDRAAAERRLYLTEAGRPTGEYRDALRAANEARAAAKQLQDQLHQVERLTADIPRLENNVQRLQRNRTTEILRLEELRQRREATQAQRSEVSRLEAEATRAEASHTEAAKAVAERAALVAKVEQAAKGLNGARKRLEDAPDVESLRAAEARAREGWQQARQAADTAGKARAVAQADLGHLRDGDALATLREREGRARAARERLREAEAVLSATASITAERLVGLEKAQTAADKAAAQLEVALARVEVTALTPIDLRMGSDHCRLAAGETAERRVSDALEIALPDVLTVRVQSGGDAERLRHGWDKARDQLRRLLEDAGAESVPAARTALQARQAAESTKALAQKDLRDTLGDESLEDLSLRRQALSERFAAYAAERQATVALPASAEEADRCQREAVQAEKAAREIADQAQAQDAQAIEELRRAELKVAVLRRETELAEEARAAAQRALEGARADATDADLVRRLEGAAEAWRRAREAHETAKAAYEGLNPDQVEMRWKNQQKVLDGIAEQQGATQSALDEARGELRALQSDGLQERYDDAERKADRAEREHARLQRLADAADLLFQTLRAHRERMLRNYQAPYRQAIEAMGRTVFGPDFGVELDDNLGVARRTLAGETLDFRLLSTGAQEQLAVLARLAGATLASGDGVPVILDDAFGYSDPERLALVGAVLAAVGDRGQVIVLTCFPERYQSVGGAHFIRVESLARVPRREGATAALEAASAREPGYAEDGEGAYPGGGVRKHATCREEAASGGPAAPNSAAVGRGPQRPAGK